MTSDGGRLTPDGTRVSLLETRAACCRNSNAQLGGQPCRSLAHSLSEWMSTKTPLPWRMSPKSMAEVTALGTMGTRQCAIDHRIRKRPSKARRLIFVSEAGPCGYWLSRYLRNKDDDCWMVAPSLLPTKADDRVKADRRDARQLAHLALLGRKGVSTGVGLCQRLQQCFGLLQVGGVKALGEPT